jgi:hypothetical protein
MFREIPLSKRDGYVSAAALALVSACVGSIETPSGSSRNPYVDESPFGDPNASSPSGVLWGSPAGNNPTNPGITPGQPGVPGTPGAPATPPPTVAGLQCNVPAVGPSPLRRVTHAEYDNSVADLLGDTTRPARQFAIDTAVGLFDNTAAEQTVPVLLADQYLDAAETLALAIQDVKAVTGCDVAAEAGCVRSFVERFARRAFRRPLASDEITKLIALNDSTKAASDADTGVRAVIAAVLASPNFLFRPEFGTIDSPVGPTGAPKPASTADPPVAGAQRASPFELASRLSSLLWASVPDDALLDAAQSGMLTTRQDVANQARRMLEDPRARGALAAFYEQWFGLAMLDSASKDPAVFPTWNDALRGALREETKRFVSHVIWEDDAKLATLLTAPYSFVNKPLADLYGTKAGSPNADEYALVQLDPQQRAGVLTQGSMLAAFARPDESSPIKRGKWIRVRMLCQELPDPPANVPQLAPPEEGVSTRERIAMHTNSPACSGCHSLIDGLGFGLENYDGIGAFRTVDHGVAVDAQGVVNNTTDADGPYQGGPELAGILAGSGQVRDCAPTQWLRYALGRREEEADNCSLKAVQDAFAASGGDLRELMIALTQTDAFWNYRQPS